VLLTLGTLVAAIAVRSTLVPSRHHFWYNVSLIVVFAAISRWCALDSRELGVARDTWRRGAIVGGLVLAGFGTVIVLGAAMPFTRSLFDDDRAEISGAAMLLKVLFVIPLGTVLMEEFAFRGVLLAQLRRLTSTTTAIAWAALAFGCWHIVTAWNTEGRIIAVVGTVAATSVAGALFGWLRVRFDSLLVPVAAHLATNSITFAAAWALAR
jgi:membrane protease YdiL (CAAX protease family)